MAVAVKHLSEKPPQLTDFRTDLPVAFRDFVYRLIQKKKEDRPKDFAAVVAEIKQIVRQVTGKEDASVPAKSKAQRVFFVDRPFRRQIGWLIGACVIVMGASASLGWTMRTPELTTISSTGQIKPRLQSAEAQLFFSRSNPQDEVAWIHLKDFNSATDEMKARAQTALAMIYLKTNRRKLAETTFEELATDGKFKANGLAGKALVAGLKGDHESARKLVAQIDGPNSRLFSEIDAAFKELQQRLNPAK